MKDGKELAMAKVDALTSEIDNTLGQLQRERLETLNAAAAIHADMQSALANEAVRIERIRGSDHVRARQLRDRLQSNARAAQALELERDVTRIVVPQTGAQDALVFGRVIDEDERGIDRLTVRLVDAAGVPVDVGDEVTDESGAFAIAIDAATVDHVMKSSLDGVVIAVYTPKGRVVHTQRKPIALSRGARILEELRVNRADLLSAPVTYAAGSSVAARSPATPKGAKHDTSATNTPDTAATPGKSAKGKKSAPRPGSKE